MANGDIAATFGFVTVKSTDDIRLGYDRINEVADLATKGGTLRFSTTAALLAYTTNAQPGQRAIDNTGQEYRWNGSSWQLWTTPVLSWTPTWTNWSPGTTFSGICRYRLADGAVHFFIDLTLTAGLSFTGAAAFSPPVPIAGALQARVMYSQGGAYEWGGIRQNNSTQIRLTYAQVNGARVDNGDVISNTPIQWAAGHAMNIHGSYLAY